MITNFTLYIRKHQRFAQVVMFNGIFEPAGRGATSTVHVDDNQIKQALAQFERCVVAQHAFGAICREIERCDINWDTSVQQDVDVPKKDMWQTFLRDTTRNFLVMGFSASVRLGVQNGLIVARALHPTETNAFYTRLCALKATVAAGAAPTKRNGKVHVAVYDAPDFATGELASSAHRALKVSEMHETILENWEQRDKLNSNATIYTSVSKELGTGASGDTSTWFSPRGVSNFQDRDFNSLVAQRELTLSRLDSITARRRENDTGRPEKMHTEHIVTDGQSAAMEARALLSQPDGRTMKDQIALAIYKFYNVPPQALGEQVNAERAGVGLGSSSATMTAKTIETFNFTIDRIVAALNVALKIESETPEGSYLELTRPVTADTIGKLLPFLKTKAVIKCFSRVYKIPESDFDAQKIEGRDENESDRKQKRSRIEREQAFATTPT